MDSSLDMRNYTAIYALALWLAGAAPATAQERLVPLVVSGSWAAMVYTANPIGPPEVCMAINLTAGIAFRTDRSGTQIRIVNEKWSLPTNAQGTFTVKIGDMSENYIIDANTSTMVSADIGLFPAAILLGHMDKAAQMTVTVGNDKPFIVSLAGSTRATNAYRTCAGMPSADAGPGTNPFR